MIFCMDFGLKRIGLAVFLHNIIMPLDPIIRKNRNQASNELKKTFLQYTNDITLITLVVGMPYHTNDANIQDNEVMEMKRRVKHFLDLIEFSGTVLYIDESYSSKEAQEQLNDRNYKIRQKARKDGKIDSLSACIILERYLANHTNPNTIIKQDLHTKASTNSQDTQNNIIDLIQDSKQDSIQQIITKQTYTYDTHAIQQADIALTSNDATTPHIPVLLEHVLYSFDTLYNPNNPNFIHKDSKTMQNTKHYLIDCTLGFGGMTKALLTQYPTLNIIGIDRDEDAINYNQALKHAMQDRLQIKHGDFANTLPIILKTLNDSKTSQVDGILADIGVSSYQLDNLLRGFSFHAKNLDMRMDTTQSLQASTILNTYNKYELERIFRDYGEIKEYKKLANLILQERNKKEITSEVLQSIALKISSRGKLHPATLIYQALRIEVNDELGQLRSLLDTCSELKGVLLCLISFHSLEDRIIKQAFKQWAKNCICDSTSFKCTCGNNHAKGFPLYKKPLSASAEEMRNNPRSRSAKLRAFYFY